MKTTHESRSGILETRPGLLTGAGRLWIAVQRTGIGSQPFCNQPAFSLPTFMNRPSFRRKAVVINREEEAANHTHAFVPRFRELASPRTRTLYNR